METNYLNFFKIKVYKNIFNFYFIRKRSTLRSIMRGYRLLKKDNKLNILNNIKRDITLIKFNIYKSNSLSNFFSSNSKKNPEIVLRQILLSKYLHSSFNKKILEYYGKNKKQPIIAPYPQEWLNYLYDKGYKISKFRSKLLWKCYTFYELINSFKAYLFTIKNTIYKSNNLIDTNKQYIYVDSISDKLIKESEKGFTNLNWIKNHINKSMDKSYSILVKANKKNLNISGLNKNNIFIYNHLYSLRKKKYILKLTLFFIKEFILSIIDYFFYGGYRSFLLTELLKCYIYKLNFKNNIIKFAFFDTSNWIYRPLWTYYAENLDTQIIFYFYSTNIYQQTMVKNHNFSDIILYGWECNTWTNFYVWNQYQAKFIKKVSKNPKISIVGPILYQNDNLKINSMKLNSYRNDKKHKIISLFDIGFVRNSIHQCQGLSLDYETHAIGIKFVKDVISICQEFDFLILYKSKRNFSRTKIFNPIFESFIRNIDYKNFVILNPETSASEVIKSSNGCISLPFTSTSVLAEHYGVKSCFYDPTNKLYSNAIQTSNIQLIKGNYQLRKWLKSLI